MISVFAVRRADGLNGFRFAPSAWRMGCYGFFSFCPLGCGSAVNYFPAICPADLQPDYYFSPSAVFISSNRIISSQIYCIYLMCTWYSILRRLSYNLAKNFNKRNSSTQGHLFFYSDKFKKTQACKQTATNNNCRWFTDLRLKKTLGIFQISVSALN